MPKRNIIEIILLCIFASVFIILSYFFKTDDIKYYNQVFPSQKPKTAYEINIDSLVLTKHKVKEGYNLSQILKDNNVENNSIDILTKKASDIFDVRKIRAGFEYILFSKKNNQVQYLVYEISPIDYVVFDLKDSIRVFKRQKKVEHRVVCKYGLIKTSLWDAIIENGATPELALKLSEIYAWSIDFYDIQKNDSYKVIYDELYVDSQPIGIAKIQASEFIHNEKNYYAFYFEQFGKGDYFDQNGNCLRRAFLKSPLHFSRISSRFSNRRFHPILKIYRPHFGVDYSAPNGTPVYTIGNGTVLDAGFSVGGGRFIRIRHNNVYSTTYMHLSGYAAGIHKGKTVLQGEVIGYVGSSGLATGPHLDFRVYKNNSPVNPLTIESPPSKPIDNNLLTAYNKIKHYFIRELQQYNNNQTNIVSSDKKNN